MAQNKTDVESLQQSGHRRGRCLDVFLVTSVVFLFAAVVGLAVAGLMAVNRLHIPDQLPEFEAAKLISDTFSPEFKPNQNFAYLEFSSIELTNANLELHQTSYGEWNSVGSNYELNNDQHRLKPLQKGAYFMYINVNVTCIADCKPGILKLNVGNKLTCNVEIPAHKTSVNKKCWNVTPMLAEGFLIQMTVPESGLSNWRLEKDSGFGMFLLE